VATVCVAGYGKERGAAWDWGGCGVAALEKATASALALPVVRSLALEKGAALSFFLFFEKQTDERCWIR
jgi:hypothetical protein